MFFPFEPERAHDPSSATAFKIENNKAKPSAGKSSSKPASKQQQQPNQHQVGIMKPTVVADEMFPEGPGPFMDLEEAGGSTGLLMDLAANEKDVHADFYNGEEGEGLIM